MSLAKSGGNSTLMSWVVLQKKKKMNIYTRKKILYIKQAYCDHLKKMLNIENHNNFDSTKIRVMLHL